MDSITAFFQNYYDQKLTIKQKEQIIIASIQYIFRLINSSQYTKQLHKILPDKPRVIDIRRDILEQGYLMKNVKLWIYYVVKNGFLRKQRQEIAKQFKIRKEDIDYLRLVGRINFAKVTKKIGKKKEGPKALTLRGFDRAVEKSIQRTDTFTKKFVFRKMAFIVKTQGIEPSDLVSDMKAEAIKSIMHYYPRIENNEHCDNIVKRKIHNEGVNKIDYYTSKKRAKLEQQEDGTFVNNAVPIQYAVFDENATEFLTADMNGKKDGADIDLTMSVRQLVRKYSGKRQQFIKLLLGYDESFSNWLSENKITKSRNDEYMDRCHNIDTYIQHCFDFIGLSEKRGNRLLRKMRKHLKDVA